MVYNMTYIPTKGMIESPVYRISSATDGDPGANYTHNNLIHGNASFVLSADDRFLIVQNYGSDDNSLNNLISIDITYVQSLDGKLHVFWP